MPVCASCSRDVRPEADPQGWYVCPACRATPFRTAPPPAPMRPAPAAPPPPPQAAGASPGWTSAPGPRERAKGAVASLVLGIVGLVTFYGAIVLGPLALVFGYKARRRVRESGGRLEGDGMAIAGIVLGWVSIGVMVLTLLLAAVVFVLVADLGDDGAIVEDTVDIGADESYTQGFYLTQPLEVTYLVDGGSDVVYATFLRVDDADDPDPVGRERWAEQVGTSITGVAHLAAGDYALYMECFDPSPCKVHFKVLQGASASANACNAQPLSPTTGAMHLPDWQPDPARVPDGGPYVVLEPIGEHYVVREPEVHTDGFQVSTGSGLVRIYMRDAGWDGRFGWPTACNRLLEGEYGDLERGRVGDRGYVDWSGNGRGCNGSLGAVVVDEAVYDEQGLASLSMRMEHHCEGAEPALMVAIHWVRP